MGNKNVKNNGSRDTEFLFEIGCLRFMPRSWKRFFNPGVANVSEHMLRVIWIAWLLAEYEGAGDKEKILKMALMHDLTESRTGDVDYLSRQYMERKEHKAINDITQGTIFEKELLALWDEYEIRKAIEAKIVKDADNLDVELELVEQEAKNHPIGNLWSKQRRKSVYPKLYTNSARKMWDKIHKSKINDWHLNTNNRFRDGDWKNKK